MINDRRPLIGRNILKKRNEYNKMFENNFYIKEKKELSQERNISTKRSAKIKKNNITQKHSIDISLNNIDNLSHRNQFLINKYNSLVNNDINKENNNLHLYHGPDKLNTNNYLNIINHKNSRDSMESVEWMYFNNVYKNYLNKKKRFIKPNIDMSEFNGFGSKNIIKKKFKCPEIIIPNKKKLIKTVKNKTNLNRNKIVINVREKLNIEKINHFVEENKLNINNNVKNRKLFQYYCLSQSGSHNRVKKINQDCYLILPNINNIKNFSIFGVLNGHGPYGDKLSKEISEFFSNYFTEKNLYNIEENKNSSKIDVKKLKIITSQKDIQSPISLSQKNFFKISKLKLINNDDDKKVKETYEILSRNNFVKIFDSFYEINNKLHENYEENKICDDSGSSLNLLMIFNSKNINKIISANLGNTKSIIIRDDKTIKELNISHTPCVKEERLRIENHGGVIDRIDWLKVGPLRVWFKGKKYPGLTITRSLGDFEAIPLGIIHIPDINKYDIDEERIKILVLATNGICEFLTNDKIMDITWQFYESKDAKAACEKIIETADKIWNIKNPHNIPDLTVSVFFFK